MNRLKEADFLRGFGIIAVIIIHLTATYVNFSSNSYTYVIWGSINRFCSFAVPLFLAVSAMVMTYKAHETEKFDAWKFYLKRLPKVIIALIIWTGIYLFYLQLNGYSIINPITHTWDFIYEYFILGKACYHLYFIPIIVQLYLLFPLVWLAIKWVGRILKDKKDNFYFSFGVCFVTLCLAQWLFLKINQWYIYAFFKNSATLLPSYILPVGMGIWLGFNLKEFYEKKWLFKLGLLLITGIIGFWYINGQLFNYKFYIRLLPMLYYTLIILSLAILARFIVRGSIFSELSRRSFFIYLFHPLVMYVLEINFKWVPGSFTRSAFVNYSLDFFARFVVVLGVSFLFAWLWGLLSGKLLRIKNVH